LSQNRIQKNKVRIFIGFGLLREWLILLSPTVIAGILFDGWR